MLRVLKVVAPRRRAGDSAWTRSAASIKKAVRSIIYVSASPSNKLVQLPEPTGCLFASVLPPLDVACVKIGGRREDEAIGPVYRETEAKR